MPARDPVFVASHGRALGGGHGATLAYSALGARDGDPLRAGEAEAAHHRGCIVLADTRPTISSANGLLLT
jgi:hypothetical protein